MEKQKLIYVESKALFSPSEVSDKAIVFIKDTKEIWTHGTYFICSNVWVTPITLTLSGDSTGSVSIDGSGNVTLSVKNNFLTGKYSYSDANNAVEPSNDKLSYYDTVLKGAANLFPSVNNANAILTLNTHDYTYNHQLGFSSNKGIYHRTRNGGTWETSWRELLTSTNYTKYPHTFASLTNKPTTLSGYGITDCIPIISGGIVTTDTDLGTLGMTAAGAKLSVFHLYKGPYPTWLNVPYMNVLMFRSTSDSYGAIGIEMMGHTVLFIGGRNAETTTNNAPNWWFRIKGNSGTTYDLNSFLNVINNLDGNYLRKSGGTLTGTLTSSSIVPRTSVTYNIGTTSAYYNNIYALYFKRKDSSDSYVLLGGGGHKLLSDLSGTHTHPWTSITNIPNYLTAANSGWSLFMLHNNFSPLWGYISTINNRLYAADVRYEVTTTNIPNPKRLFDGGYSFSSNIIPAGTTATINIPYSRTYGDGTIYLCFYNSKTPASAIVTVTVKGTDYVLTKEDIGSSVWAYPVTPNIYIQNINISITASSSSECRIAAIEYSARRTETLNDIAVITNYTSNTLLYQLTAPKYIVKNGTSSLFLKADGSLDNNAYLPLSGGTMTGNITWNTDSHGIYFYGGCGIEKWPGYGPTLIAEGNTDFYIRNNTDRADYHKIIHTGNYSSYALPISGGTMTGALNFKNNTWNKVGDDAYMGDCNVAGMIGIKGSNAATPGFVMYNNSGTLLGKLYASGTSLYWSDAKILTASGTSTLFVMGDGSLYSDTIRYDTWTKTTTSGTAWFPIADVTDDGLGTALFMVKAYAHSSIIFTVVKGWNNGNINVLAGGGNFNNDYAYIRGVRLVGTVVEIGLHAAATLVLIIVKIILPTYAYSLRSSLVESTNTTTPYVQYDINSGGNYDFGIISSKFTGNLIGNADTASNISTVNPILALPFEKNAIQVVSNPLGALAEQLGTAAAITHALRFNWYNTAYEIGNVRGGASNSLGFGITYGNNNLCLLVKTDGTYSPYGFIGSLSGNASTASKWKDARTITLTGDVTGSVTLDGSSNVTLTTTTSGSGTTSFLKCPDKRNSYPAEIVTSGLNIGASFMTASKLGISGDGSYYDTLIIRGYSDNSGGKENAIMFSKNTSSVYHSQYDFGSTTTWGTMYKFLDSNNYSSYALPLSGGTMTGKLTMLASSMNTLPTIHRNHASYISGIRLENDSGYLGTVGMNAVNGSLYIMGTNESLYPVLDSRNYSNYAAAKSHTHPWSDITGKPEFDLRFVYATSSTYYSYGTTEASGSSSTLTRTLFWRDNDRALIGMYVQHSTNIDYGFELASSYGADALIYRRKFNGTWGSEQTILTSNNYSNYTINHTKSGINNTGFVGVVNGNNLYYHNELSFARFAPDDNGGATSYELIAELINYDTGANTGYINYGISGFMWSYRGGNCNNSSAYPITAIVSVGPYTSSRIRVPVTTNVLVPVIVKYTNKYYLALKKSSSSTGFYFMGQKLNLLTTTIKVNDISLIEEIKGPENETSTALYYYNKGNPQEYLHAGNYKNFYPIKLLYPRTFWGLSFDGSANVNGCINIIRDSSFTNNYNEGIRILGAGNLWCGIFLGTDGTTLGYTSTQWNISKTAVDSLRISRGATSSNMLDINTNGNVGIGNTSPSYKLSVNGDIYSSGYVRGNSGFIKTNSSDLYVLLGGGGHKLLSDLSSTHTHDWSSITSKPSLLGAMAAPIFYPYANDIKLGAYISTINNRFYSADLRYTVTTTNLSGDKHYLFDDNYDQRMLMDPGTTATITIEGYNFVYNNGYIMLYFYLYNAYPLKFPKSITAKATISNGTVYTLNRVTAVESGNTIAFLIGLEYLTKLEFTIVAQDDAYCGITNIDYYSRRTENTVRDCAVVTKYNANTLYHNLTAPKYIVSGGTSSQFLKADGSLDSTSYLKVDGTNGTSDGVSTLLNKLTTGSSTPVDADYYICQYAGGGTTTTSYHRRPMSAMYAYIKSKATSDFLPIGGGTLGSSTASLTALYILSSTANMRLMAYSDSTNYIQSGNSDFSGNATLKITGYSNTTGTNLYFNFANIYCRANNYTNIDSGNYSSYALPLSGGTLTGTLISRDIRPSANVSYSLGTSSYYYNYVYAKYFKKNGSSDSYVLLGGGGHKAVSDFTLKELKKTTSISGNTDQWSIILEQSYPADYWYDVINTFLVEGVLFGSGFLSFYAYWNASSSSFLDYITEVYFNGVMRNETTNAFGGSNRDINDYLRIYIDKTNYKLLVYANHYNGKTVRIKRINYNEIETSGFPNGGILVEHFNDKGTIVSLPTESSTMTRVLIKTHYNHDRTIKTSKSIYASSFYENSDIRLKENIRRIDLSDLTKLVDLVQFNFKDSDTKKYGVIAQLLELVGLQNLVYENDGKKAVDYISLLVLEIQRLRNEIGELKLEINKKS